VLDRAHLEHKVAVLTRLAEISTVLNSTVQLKPLLAFLMDFAAEITEAEAASVLLWDDNRRELYIAATTTSTADLDLVGQPVPLENSIAGAIMQLQQTIQVDDVHTDPRHYRKLDTAHGFETRSILGVPLTAREQPIGVLEVLNKRRLPWTEDDRSYLGILAAQAAVAIESARLVERLKRANRELSELDKLKSDFIAIASHELRTPLGVILGYASFLRDTSEGEVSYQAGKMVSSALHLRRIIEDLTSLRYLREETVEVNRERLPVRQLLTTIPTEIHNLYESRGHQLDIQPVPDNLILDVDPVQVGMAFIHLLRNAATFTPTGGHVTVACEKRSSAEAWISVRDNGMGLSSSDLERIFEPFFQVADHMTRTHGGIGVGLSIARAIAQANGGRLWASSPGPGQGATFTLALPLAKHGTNR
jgi:signal transduction histidine kinase